MQKSKEYYLQRNYYLQVFFVEWKYVIKEKRVHNYVTDDVEIFSDHENSDEEDSSDENSSEEHSSKENPSDEIKFFLNT